MQLDTPVGPQQPTICVACFNTSFKKISIYSPCIMQLSTLGVYSSIYMHYYGESSSNSIPEGINYYLLRGKLSLVAYPRLSLHWCSDCILLTSTLNVPGANKEYNTVFPFGVISWFVKWKGLYNLCKIASYPSSCVDFQARHGNIVNLCGYIYIWEIQVCHITASKT